MVGGGPEKGSWLAPKLAVGLDPPPRGGAPWLRPGTGSPDNFPHSFPSPDNFPGDKSPGVFLGVRNIVVLLPWTRSVLWVTSGVHPCHMSYYIVRPANLFLSFRNIPRVILTQKSSQKIHVKFLTSMARKGEKTIKDAGWFNCDFWDWKTGRKIGIF